MTAPARLRGDASEHDVAHDVADTETGRHEKDPSAPQHPMPLPGAAKATVGKIAFAWTWSEITSFGADVTRATTDHPLHLQAIDTALADVAGNRLVPADIPTVTAELVAVRKILVDLTGTKISFEARAAALAAIAAAGQRIATATASITASKGKQKAIDDAAAEADRTAKAEADARERAAQLEAERKATADAEAKAEADRKAQAEAEAQRRAKEQADAAAEAERQAKEQAEAAAERERRAREAAAAKAKAEVEAKERAQAEAEAEAAARAKDEADRLAREEAETRAAGLRAAAFGDRSGAYSAATSAAVQAGAETKDARVEAADAARSDAIATLPAAPKIKGRRPGPPSPAETARAAGIKAADAQHRQAKTAAERAGDDREHAVGDEFAALASSASGATLSDADLSWAINACRRNPTLAQALADIAVAAKDVSVAKQVAGGEADLGRARDALAMLTRGVPAASMLRALALCATADNATVTWLRNVAPADLDEAVTFAGMHTAHGALAALVGASLGTGPNAYLVMEALAAGTADAKDTNWLLGLRDAKDFLPLCQAVRNAELRLSKVRAVHAAAGENFTLAEVTRICRDSPQHLHLVPDIFPHADAHAPTFIRLWIAIGAGKPPFPLLRLALRAEALLTDAPACAAATFSIEKRDTAYGRGSDTHGYQNAQNDARTGFLLLDFPDNTQAMVHSHWNAAKSNVGRITSMHIKNDAGDNGTELNQWFSVFPNLVRAALAAHNAGTGARVPTGGPLSMP